jgi:hypothetical protein
LDVNQACHQEHEGERQKETDQTYPPSERGTGP